MEEIHVTCVGLGMVLGPKKTNISSLATDITSFKPLERLMSVTYEDTIKFGEHPMSWSIQAL